MPCHKTPVFPLGGGNPAPNGLPLVQAPCKIGFFGLAHSVGPAQKCLLKSPCPHALICSKRSSRSGGSGFWPCALLGNFVPLCLGQDAAKEFFSKTWVPVGPQPFLGGWCLLLALLRKPSWHQAPQTPGKLFPSMQFPLTPQQDLGG